MESTAASLKPQSTAILGQYQPFVRYARGGMADVFLAKSVAAAGMDRIVILKRLREDISSEDSSLAAMFLDEARLSLNLSHPGIIPIYDVGEHDGAFYIAMEFVEGQPLNRLRSAVEKKKEVFPPVLAVQIATETLAALHYAHEFADRDGVPLHIVHRDVSPQNILLGYDGRVRLLDFGVAKAAGREVKTEVGVLKGKVRYMAPEQVLATRGQATVDGRADVFALGVVLWELLAGRRLREGADDLAALLDLVQLEVPFPSLASVAPHVDARLAAIADRALQKRPDDRYATASEMKRELDRWLALQDEEPNLQGALATYFAEERQAVSRKIRDMATNAPTSARSFQRAGMDELIEFERTGASLVGSAPSGARTHSGRAAHSSRRPVAPTLVSRDEAGLDAASQRAAPSMSVPAEGPTQNKLPWAIAAVALLLVVALGTWNVARRPSSPPAVAAAAALPTAAPTPVVTSTAASPSVPAVADHASEAAAPGSSAAAADKTKKGFVYTARATPAATEAKPEAPPPAVAPAAPGFFTVDTYPATRVSVDGRPLGETPLVRISLAPGPHTVTFDDGAGLHKSSTIEIKSGEALSRRFSFE